MSAIVTCCPQAVVAPIVSLRRTHSWTFKIYGTKEKHNLAVDAMPNDTWQGQYILLKMLIWLMKYSRPSSLLTIIRYGNIKKNIIFNTTSMKMLWNWWIYPVGLSHATHFLYSLFVLYSHSFSLSAEDIVSAMKEKKALSSAEYSYIGKDMALYS